MLVTRKTGAHPMEREKAELLKRMELVLEIQKSVEELQSAQKLVLSTIGGMGKKDWRDARHKVVETWRVCDEMIANWGRWM